MKTATDIGTQTLLDKRLLKVLLVDDEATDRIAVEWILRTCSSPAEFVVESVVRLSEAIKKLTEKQYDVVLLDLELPDSSGIEILHHVVKVAPDIPVVVLTERDDEQTGFSALVDGATDYLVKDLPLDVVLVRTIIYAIQRKKIQMQSMKLAHDNNERMKELNCLYGISNIVETPGISLDEMLEKTVSLIPAGWQYPDIACARIIFEGKEYKTDNFKPSKWTQSADITLQGQKAGTVDVGYMEQRPQSNEGPFLEEKRDLIDAIGERLGKMAERFKAEEVLREKSALLVKVINSVPDFIFAKDTKVRTIICNEAYASAVGKKPEEMIGHTDIENGWDTELVCGNPVKGIRGFENDDRDALSGKTIHNPYDPANTPKGVLIFDTYKMPLHGKDGEIVGMLGISRDITERKRAEETLRESEERYKNLFKASVDGILIADTTTKKFRYANPAICRMLGYGEEEFTHMGVADIHPKESLGLVVAEFEAQASGAKTTAKDLPCVRKDGQVISVSINAVTVMIDQAKYLLGIFHDITECKSKEKRDFS
jgi:PAS domain S-box-containing protein